MTQPQLINNIEIIDIADEGKAVAKADGLVIFVKDAVPGDWVDIAITKKKKSLAEGTITNIIKPSPYRTKPFCSHFGICGGCKWQHLQYEKQLEFKQKQVADCFSRIGKVDTDNLIKKIIGSPITQYYRNKLEFTFSNKKWLLDYDKSINKESKSMDALGFHIPRFFNKVLDIEYCHLQPEPSNAIRKAIKAFAIENNYSFYDFKAQKGLLRNVIIRNTLKNNVMVLFSFGYNDTEKIELLLNFIGDKFSNITSLNYVINEKKNDSISDLPVYCYKGSNYIVEELGKLKFKISPQAFFQTNSLQAKKLYNTVVDLAKISEQDVVYDLYTGTGTIANYVAGKAKKVVGIEYIASAIEDAKENSRLNNIQNTIFVCGDIAKVLNANFFSEYKTPGIVITDPPRAGMHKDVILQLLQVLPKRIVYVSCNPATQSRDVELLSSKYTVTSIQPVDMFPHTQHVESVCCLERKME